MANVFDMSDISEDQLGLVLAGLPDSTPSDEDQGSFKATSEVDSGLDVGDFDDKEVSPEFQEAFSSMVHRDDLLAVTMDPVETVETPVVSGTVGSVETQETVETPVVSETVVPVETVETPAVLETVETVETPVVSETVVPVEESVEKGKRKRSGSDKEVPAKKSKNIFRDDEGKSYAHVHDKFLELNDEGFPDPEALDISVHPSGSTPVPSPTDSQTMKMYKLLTAFALSTVLSVRSGKVQMEHDVLSPFLGTDVDQIALDKVQADGIRIYETLSHMDVVIKRSALTSLFKSDTNPGGSGVLTSMLSSKGSDCVTQANTRKFSSSLVRSLGEKGNKFENKIAYVPMGKHNCFFVVRVEGNRNS